MTVEHGPWLLASAFAGAVASACASAQVKGAAAEPGPGSREEQFAPASAAATTTVPATATTASIPPRAKPAATIGTVIVDLVGLESAQGQVQVALFRSAQGFPDRPGRAFARSVHKAQPGTLRIVFAAVPAGPFAVAVHHDEDADRAMDTGLFGMPKEGYGFSRDAQASFGPPDFAASKLTLAAGQHMRVRVHLRY